MHCSKVCTLLLYCKHCKKRLFIFFSFLRKTKKGQKISNSFSASCGGGAFFFLCFKFSLRRCGLYFSSEGIQRFLIRARKEGGSERGCKNIKAKKNEKPASRNSVSSSSSCDSWHLQGDEKVLQLVFRRNALAIREDIFLAKKKEKERNGGNENVANSAWPTLTFVISQWQTIQLNSLNSRAFYAMVEKAVFSPFQWYNFIVQQKKREIAIFFTKFSSFLLSRLLTLRTQERRAGYYLMGFLVFL